jgi:hypothetical protein
MFFSQIYLGERYMAVDAEKNNTTATAVGGGLLSIKHKGSANDVTFGSVGGKGDPIDYFSYATLKGLQAVSAEVSFSSQDLVHKLAIGGVNGATMHAEISGSGAFGGKKLVLEAKIGSEANEDFGTKVADLSQAFVNLYNDTTDDPNAVQNNSTFVSSATNIVEQTLEINGVNADPAFIKDQLESLISDNPLQETQYSDEILQTVEDLSTMIQQWSKIHYYVGYGAKLKEVSAAAFKSASVTWQATGGRSGYLSVDGFSHSSTATGNLKLDPLSYTAKIQVGKETASSQRALEMTSDAQHPHHHNEPIFSDALYHVPLDTSLWAHTASVGVLNCAHDHHGNNVTISSDDHQLVADEVHRHQLHASEFIF